MCDDPYVRLLFTLLLIAANIKEFALFILMLACLLCRITEGALDFVDAREVATHCGFTIRVLGVECVAPAVHPANDTVLRELADDFITEFMPRYGEHRAVSG